MDEIQKLEQNKDDYVSQPGKDFSRKRKLSFSNVISSLISMEAGSIQQRDKISHLALRNLFYSFTSTLNPKPSAVSYRYYAVDGLKVNIPMVTDPDEDYTYFSREDQRLYCQIHLDAIFDRGYEGYALMAHISTQNQYYVIRAKDRKNGGIIKGINLQL